MLKVYVIVPECSRLILKKTSVIKLEFNISFGMVCSILLHETASLTVQGLKEFMILLCFSPKRYNTQNAT